MSENNAPPPDLSRFITAQRGVYHTALQELNEGCKRTHWMWYIFPQVAGLGFSETSRFYAIHNRAEARQYLAHELLGKRLVTCCEAVRALEGKSIHDIFGSPDDMKMKSCITLFASLSAPGSVFERILNKYFQGRPDERTLEILTLMDD